MDSQILDSPNYSISILSGGSPSSNSQKQSTRSTAASRIPDKRRLNNFLTIGDKVKIIIDLSLFREIQETHGGWSTSMSDLIGQVGIIHRVTERGDFRVSTSNNTRWTIYAFALNRVDSVYTPGSFVIINEDERIVRHVQKTANLWNAELKQIIGKPCKINAETQNGFLRVEYNNYEYVVTKEICYSMSSPAYQLPFASFQLTPRNANQDCTKNMLNELLCLNLNETVMTDKIEALIINCANGELEKVRELLKLYPSIIDQKHNGRAALHAASFHGHIEIVELFIELKANLEIKDSDGDTPLHYCCFSNRFDICKLLVENNVSINSVNKNGSSPLHVAVNKQNINCVQVLIDQKCDVNIQDSYGDTPLHDVAGKAKKLVNVKILAIIDLLLNAPAVNLFLKNKMDFNIFQYACIKGNDLGIQRILNKCPDIINVRKADGFSGLHLAALNGQADCVKQLISYKADIEILNNKKQTPLLLAVTQFNVPIIEQFVESGANLNAGDQDGDTCLHLLLNERIANKDTTNLANQQSLLESSLLESKNISKIVEKVAEPFKANLRLAVALYLIENGADPYCKNNSQMSCIDYVKDKSVKNFLICYYSDLRKLEVSEVGSMCKLCDEDPCSVIFLPCRHKVCCAECSVRLKKCVDCNEKIEEKLASTGSRSSRKNVKLNDLLDKISRLEEAQTCAICMERKKEIAFQCGHIVCGSCSTSLVFCHICRELIVKRIKIYEN